MDYLAGNVQLVIAIFEFLVIAYNFMILKIKIRGIYNH